MIKMRVKDLMTIIFQSSSHNHLVKRQCDLREKVSMIKICITTVEIGHWSMSILSMEHLQEDVRTMLNKRKRCEYLFIYYFTTGLFLTETRALPEISSRQENRFWHTPPPRKKKYKYIWNWNLMYVACTKMGEPVHIWHFSIQFVQLAK